MNIPVLAGSSGSPIFIEKSGKYHFIGIATMMVKGTCHALRASAIKECFANFFRYTAEHE
jgi:V8-like Glu-specific endopeptidase